MSEGKHHPPRIDLEKCKGCGVHEQFGPWDLVFLEPGRCGEALVKYPEKCRHRGICRLQCPEGTISYRFPPEMPACG
jgi:NAD-dependent dihydropyrimidine dehydrogenase PreA subunit